MKMIWSSASCQLAPFQNFQTEVISFGQQSFPEGPRTHPLVDPISIPTIHELLLSSNQMAFDLQNPPFFQNG